MFNLARRTAGGPDAQLFIHERITHWQSVGGRALFVVYKYTREGA